MISSGTCILLQQPQHSYLAGYSHSSSYAALQLPQQRALHPHSRACRASSKHTAPTAAAATSCSSSHCQSLAAPQHFRCRSSSRSQYAPRAASASAAAAAATPATPTPAEELSVGGVVEVACERLGTGGVGVCLWGPSQLVLLVKGALPGEQLTAIITTVKKNYAEGRKLSTQHPHRDAVQPACQHFGTCGGCNLQSLSYLAQLDHKAAYVGQRFSRVGKLNPVDVAAAQQPAVAAEAVYGCRNKVQMAFSSLVWQADADQVQPGQQQQLEPPQAQQQQEGTVRQGFGLGYFLPGSNSVVVPIQECSLLSHAMNHVVHRVLELCQQHKLQPHNSPDGKGVLRHLIIRSAAAAAAVASSASASTAEAAAAAGTAPPTASVSTAAAAAEAVAPAAPAVASPAAPAAAATGHPSPPGPAASVLMVVLVTSPSVKKQPEALKALAAVARELYKTCPGVVSVISSVEAPGVSSKLGGPNRATHRSRQQGRGGSKREGSSRVAGGSGSDSAGSDSSSSSRGAQPLRVQSSKVLAGTDKLLETLCGLQFEISPHSFFQTNTAQAGRLYEIAVQAAAEVVGAGTGGGEGASDMAAAAGDSSSSSSSSSKTAVSSLEPGDGHQGEGIISGDSGVVLDLYCGTGTIALCLAAALPGRQVVGFDVSSAAIADARANADRNGISNVDFVRGDLNQLLPSSQGSLRPIKQSSRQQEGPRGKHKPRNEPDAAADQHSEQPGGQSLQSLRPSVVVVDPARAGLGQGVVQYLLRCGASRVVYVSCNAATQARDLQLLCSSGEFKLASWVCVDLFPQTDVAHVETVVVLDRVI